MVNYRFQSPPVPINVNIHFSYGILLLSVQKKNILYFIIMQVFYMPQLNVHFLRSKVITTHQKY